MSDLLDVGERCYACGWEHNDPGDLEWTGNEEGDTIANMKLVDACDEDVELWDFAGQYHILFFTAEWCGVCKAEVNGHDAALAVFKETSDVPVDFIDVLFQDVRGGPPGSESAVVEMLRCWDGAEGDPEAFELIRGHAADGS